MGGGRGGAGGQWGGCGLGGVGSCKQQAALAAHGTSQPVGSHAPRRAHLSSAALCRAVCRRLAHIILVSLGHHQVAGVVGPHVQAGDDALGQAPRPPCAPHPHDCATPCRAICQRGAGWEVRTSLACKRFRAIWPAAAAAPPPPPAAHQCPPRAPAAAPPPARPAGPGTRPGCQAPRRRSSPGGTGWR